MSHRTIFVLAVLVLLGLFAGLNWDAFNAPTKLNLLFTQAEAPLGVVMLVIVAVLTLLYLVLTLGIEAAALLEVRRYARELHQARKLAENAEASRFTALRNYLEQELAALKEAHASLSRHLDERTEEVQKQIRALEERLTVQFDTLKVQHKEILQKQAALTESLKAHVKEEIERATNTLAAYIGELEDRIAPDPETPET